MSQPFRVQVEKKGAGSGCGTLIAGFLVLGLLVAYWYVAVGLVAVAGVAGLVYRSQQKKKLRHRPGVRDPWLNEVVVALAEFGFTEHSRNTGSVLGGVRLEGDIELLAERFRVYVNLLPSDAAARQAQTALLAKPETRKAVSDGRSVLHTEGPILYVATGRGGVVDEATLNEVVQIVSQIPLPAALPVERSARPSSRPGVLPYTVPAPDPRRSETDPIDDLRRLAELQESGVLTQAEFDAKKQEILRRI